MSLLENGCRVTQAAACSDIQDKEKLYSCDLKSFCSRTSLDTAIAGVKGCGLGVWSGTFEGVWDVLKGLGQIVAYSAECNSDVEQKLDLIDRFNEAIPEDESFKTPPKQVLQKMACTDLLKEFSAKVYEISAKKVKQGAAAVSQEIDDIRTKKKKISLKAGAEKVLDQLKVRRECYNTKALAEMYCEAGTIAATTAIGGLGALRAAKLAKIAELSKSVQVETAAAKLAKAGEAVMATASKLSNKDRLGVAESLLGRTLTKEQKDALIAAHEVGKERGAGFFTYTEQELRDKARKLRSAGFSSAERDLLMRNGIAGSSPTSDIVKASMSQTKTFKLLPEYERTTRLKVFELRDSLLQRVESQAYRVSTMSYSEKLEYLRDVKGLAEATRVAGESAGSVGDLAASQKLTKDAISRLERVAKDAPQLMSGSRERDTLFELRVRAGDSEGAAKTFVENAKLDWQAEGMPNATASLNDRFNNLKRRAESGPTSFVLDNERGTGKSFTTGRPIPATNASAAYLKQINELKTLDKIIESKPTWLVNFDYARERSRLQSLMESAKRELVKRGYNPDQL